MENVPLNSPQNLNNIDSGPEATLEWECKLLQTLQKIDGNL